MKCWMTRTVAVALGALVLWPAEGIAQTPPPAAPPAAAVPEPPRFDPKKVVPASNDDPLDLLEKTGDEIKLSDEKLITRWSHAQSTAKIRQFPRRSGRTVARLRFETEDRLPEVYLALRARQDSAGRHWVQIRIPKRPNGRKGWVEHDMISSFNVVRTQLVVDRRKLRATLYKQGKKIWSARVGIGKRGTPTPRGQFWIRERLRGLGGTYGPWAFGTSAYSNLSDWPGGGVVGIHGTNQPGLIPGRPSHGCIRVRNDKIRQLARRMPIGTPVRIIN